MSKTLKVSNINLYTPLVVDEIEDQYENGYCVPDWEDWLTSECMEQYVSPGLHSFLLQGDNHVDYWADFSTTT